ncbi:hypothetical protein BSZ36_00350 [Rubricoccus marinus]|uniref:Uncharacterized protein n=1 Tax=Rubricoccus marinus TaxID=716817 RepID=A0A259TUX0_9BACT|nr:hypothetical protein BSZ36_00350 [Rubricoccus marinus]
MTRFVFGSNRLRMGLLLVLLFAASLFVARAAVGVIGRAFAPDHHRGSHAHAAHTSHGEGHHHRRHHRR